MADEFRYAMTCGDDNANDLCGSLLFSVVAMTYPNTRNMRREAAS